jgi:hypothetical protein
MRVLSWAAAAAILLMAGCGSSAEPESEEAQAVLEEIESLQEGEIVVRGITTPRVTGPYTFKPGGYVLRFEQTGDGDQRIVVALESRPNSRRAPYQRLVDTTALSGSAQVGVSGRLYVHVFSAAGDYALRFTPKRKRQ